MEIITVNHSNIDTEHICCAISDKKGENCVSSKKAWLKERFSEGLVFKKANVRGKVFIEYIPADRAWCPIHAKDYMFINCFWVSGQYKGQGISNLLLKECIADSQKQGKEGLVIVSSKNKLPFLSDPKYLKYKGFLLADTASPYFELLYMPFNEKAEKPSFRACTKSGQIYKKDIVLYYTNQCPHTEKYVEKVAQIAKVRGVAFTSVKYKSASEAQGAPSPFTTYSLFYNGIFVTNEILSEKKFIKFLEEKGLGYGVYSGKDYLIGL
ncbi:YoaP domain-containing protein [Cellulosilyticum sp. I15G10I2]|uniref:YoaP domain-containing protein n=1 Tax=Cellulosilyticum sp. I15G10I2 TaxID=1892843 RepID=UPI00085C2345|nr:YoaP domain-containing protein [Cellulosilyticum sp. I15G10I2]